VIISLVRYLVQPDDEVLDLKLLVKES